MQSNTTARVDSLVPTKTAGVTTRARSTVHAAMPCFAEVATPKGLSSFPGKWEKAEYILTWRQSGLANGQILTLAFDAKDYTLGGLKFDQIGGYYVGVLSRLQ